MIRGEDEMTHAEQTAEQPRLIRGALEGFYGTFYTFEQRTGLIRFLGQQGFTSYLYGPKNDRYHRAQWRAPYPQRYMAQFQQTVQIAREAGISFGYALSPGATISYHAADDFDCLTAKLSAFYEIGVRQFSLFLDDIDPQFADSADAAHYSSYAEAQADLCNRTLAWLQALDQACTLSMCPTDYHGAPPFGDYLQQLGAKLNKAIDVFYTGPQICSTTISRSDVEAFARAAGRRPLIWDNYPVNDLAMQPELHIGPLRGRQPDLLEGVAGVYANLMLQSEASKIPLVTIGAYLDDAAAYEPDEAWQQALRSVAGEESAAALRLLGENSLRCCLRTPEAARLTALAGAALQALQQDHGLDGPPFETLQAYLQQLDDACYHLRYDMANTELRQEILPWIEGLAMQQDMGQHALAVLRAAQTPARRPMARLPQVRRLKELLADVQAHHKRIGGESLLPLAHEALRRAEILRSADSATDERS